MEGQSQVVGARPKWGQRGQLRQLSAPSLGQPLSALLPCLLGVLGDLGQPRKTSPSKTSLPVQTRKYQSGCHDRVWPRGLRGLRGLGEGRGGLNDPA